MADLWRRLVWALGLVLLAQTIEAKRISGKAYLAPERINEISKFNFGVGTGHINGTFEFMGTPKGTIYLFKDTHWWDKFHAEEACSKIRHAHTKIPIGSTGARIGRGLGHARGEDIVDATKGKKKWAFSWQISHKDRTSGWYLVLADCHSKSTQAEDENSKRKKKKRKRRNRAVDRYTYELDFLNPGGNHLSADEYWLTEIYIFVTVSLIGGWFYFSKLMQKTFGNGSRHLVIWFIRFAYGFQLVSMSFEIIHQVLYRYNGYGIWFFDFLSEVFEGLSQTFVSFVLLCLANGWTFSSSQVKNKYDPSIKEVLNNPSLMDIDNPVLLLLVVFMFFSIVLQLVNKLYDESFMKFHDHETYAGLALMCLRFVFGILFFFSLTSTIQKEKQKGAGTKFIGFLTNLMISGSVWFLSFPLTVFFAGLMPHYLRHFIVSSGVLLTQSVCLCVLSYEFGSNRSMFAKFSQVQQAGMLPGFSRTPVYDKFA